MSNRPDDACPKCGEALLYNEVDIGVGIQYSAPWCSDEACGWQPTPWEQHECSGRCFDPDDPCPIGEAGVILKIPKTCLQRALILMEHQPISLVKAAQEWCSNCRLLFDSMFEATSISHLTIEEANQQYPCVDDKPDAGEDMALPFTTCLMRSLLLRVPEDVARSTWCGGCLARQGWERIETEQGTRYRSSWINPAEILDGYTCSDVRRPDAG